MIYFFIPLFLILQFAPAALPAQREICLQMKGYQWNWNEISELVIDINIAPAIFLQHGTKLVISSDDYSQSYFEGAAEEMVRRYCG